MFSNNLFWNTADVQSQNIDDMINRIRCNIDYGASNNYSQELQYIDHGANNNYSQELQYINCCHTVILNSDDEFLHSLNLSRDNHERLWNMINNKNRTVDKLESLYSNMR